MKIDNCFKLIKGKQLGYALYGQEGGMPALYFHGLPGSRREGELLHQACLGAGVFLIAPDRPGYGLSEMVDGSRLGNWPNAIAQLLDYLAIDYCYLFAASGGAPYALACASVLYDRVIGTGICCGLGEVAKVELRRDMSAFARLSFWLAQRQPGWLQYSYGVVIPAAAKMMPYLSLSLLAWLLGDPDASVLRESKVKIILAGNLREAFRQGSRGGIADIHASIEPWPFDLKPIRNIQLWHGVDDSVVPIAHSHWMLLNIPTADLQCIEGEGHFSLPVRHAGQIINSLVSAYQLPSDRPAESVSL
jgi:pimeloyl-ACP methyl ester carboxylesterase